MAQINPEQLSDEILDRKGEMIENQFILGEQNEMKLVTRDDSMRENAVDIKNSENRYENLSVLEKVEQRGSIVEQQSIKKLSKHDQNVLKSSSKIKNIETQTSNTINQVKRSQYTLYKGSNPQNIILTSTYQTTQMSPKIEINPKTIIDPLYLEQKIKEIAKNIRNKVKKDNSPDRHNEESSVKKVINFKGRQHKLNPLRQSPLSLQKNNNLTINPNQFLDSKLLTFEQNITVQVNPKKIVRNILGKQILEKVYKQIETRQKIKVKKLKLDPINHHYPMTSFRKSIIQEIKSNTLRESQKEKERQAKLSKRRDIYNSSRYQRYAKLGNLLKRDLFDQKLKDDQVIIQASRLNPEAEQLSLKIEKETQAIKQIDSLIYLVNNSEVKQRQEKQPKQTEYEWQQR